MPFKKHVTEGEIGGTEVVGRQGRRRKQLLNDIKEKSGCWKLEDDALDAFCGELTFERAMKFVRQTREWWHMYIIYQCVYVYTYLYIHVHTLVSTSVPEPLLDYLWETHTNS